VEHPVTEMITGIDLVQEQIRVAAGERLSFRQQDVVPRGHAIECRINAEDYRQGFRPTPGRLTRWRPPVGENLRLDTHCYEGYLVSPYYDSMLAKLIGNGTARRSVIHTLRQALDDFTIEGVSSTVPLHQAVLASEAFANGEVTTRWLEDCLLPEWQGRAN
jgi:acetyl-CoA carboxylase, biotin carboxylase subunit